MDLLHRSSVVDMVLELDPTSDGTILPREFSDPEILKLLVDFDVERIRCRCGCKVRLFGLTRCEETMLEKLYVTADFLDHEDVIMFDAPGSTRQVSTSMHGYAW